MKITREQKLYQLAFMPRFFPVNAYFVEEEDSLTLIDAAMPFSAKGILKAAQGIGKPIARIVLTHAHGDHIGALDALKAELPNAKVYISARDARLLAGDTKMDPEEFAGPLKGSVPKPGAIKTKPDVLLHEGDRVGSLLAISTPGHTPGSMSFFDTRTRALIAGDALQTRGGIAVAGQVRPWFPFPAMATWSKEDGLASVVKLQELNPSILAVGHGKLLANPQSAIAGAVKEAQRNLQNQRSRNSHVTQNRT